MHTHNFQHWLLQNSFSEREGRECFDSLETPGSRPANTAERGVTEGVHNMLLRGKEYLENPEIQEVKKLYADVITSKFPELDNPVDKTNFFALLYDRVMPKEEQTREVNGHFKRAGGTNEYGNLWKIAGSDIANPWKIQSETLKPEQQKMMGDVRRAFNDFQTSAAPGERNRPVIPVEALILNVQKFKDWKSNLDAKLQAVSVRVQTTQKNDPMKGSGELLSTEEYFLLLSLLAEGKQDDVNDLLKFAKDPGTPEERFTDAEDRQQVVSPAMRLRKALWEKVGVDREGAKSSVPEKPSRLDALASRRRDILLPEMGPNALLNQFGIHLGHLRHAYICERQSPVTSKPGESKSATPEAALWPENPMLLHQFLLRSNVPQTVAGDYIQSGDGNKDFLEALQYYFGDESMRQGAVQPKFSKEDTRAVVALISESLRLSDSYVINVRQEVKKLQTQLNLGTKIENYGGDIWEYLKDVKEHPIGSALLAVVGVIALKKLWGATLGKDQATNRPITNFLLQAGVIVGAAELFYQHKEGKSLVGAVMQKVDAMRGKELSLPAGERTLGKLWANECKLTDSHQRAALSLLEEQPTDKVFEWYRDVKGQDRTGVKMKKLPFSIKNKSEIFGQKSDEEISEIFYKALTKFFENRGAAVKTYPWMKFTNPDDAAIGEEYLRKTYIEKGWFKYIATTLVREVKLSDDGSKIVEALEKNGEFQATLQQNPALYKQWMVFRVELIRESKKTSDAKFPMFYIFTGEMDEGIATKMQNNDAWLRFLKDAKRWTDTKVEGTKNVLKKTIQIGGDSWEIVEEAGGAILQKIETPGQTVVDGVGIVANAPKYFYDTAKKTWELLNEGDRVTGPIADSAITITDAMEAQAKEVIKKLKH